MGINTGENISLNAVPVDSETVKSDEKPRSFLFLKLGNAFFNLIMLSFLSLISQF